MPVISVTQADARLAHYGAIREPELAVRHGLFVAEGRLVIERLIELGQHRIESLLLTPTARAALADSLHKLDEATPIYEADRSVLSQIAGFDIHRGSLALARRPAPLELEAVLGDARTLLLLDSLTDADNVGSIFRSAWALGGDAIILGSTTCDPLYRKAIRTSMAATLAVPFSTAGDWPAAVAALRANGFKLVALTPGARVSVDAFVDDLPRDQKIAFILGTEGAGIGADLLAESDAQVRIPLRSGVDSLNVGVAAGIALARLGRAGGGDAR